MTNPQPLELLPHEQALIGDTVTLIRPVEPQPSSTWGDVPQDAEAHQPYSDHPDLWVIMSDRQGVQQYERAIPFAKADAVEYFRERLPFIAGASYDADGHRLTCTSVRVARILDVDNVEWREAGMIEYAPEDVKVVDIPLSKEDAAEAAAYIARAVGRWAGWHPGYPLQSDLWVIVARFEREGV